MPNRIWLFRILMPAALILALTACDSGNESPAERHIRKADSFAQLFAADRRVELQLPRAALSDAIVDIAILPAGRIAAAAGKRGVQLFSADGKFLKKLGTGRAAIGAATQLGMTPKGNLTVFDLQRAQQIVFAPDGRFITKFRVPQGAAGVVLNKNGDYLYSVSGQDQSLVLCDRAGKVKFSFSTLPPTIKSMQAIKQIVTRQPLITFADRGTIFQAFPTEYKLYKFGPTGRLIGSFARENPRYRGIDQEVLGASAVNGSTRRQLAHDLLANISLVRGMHHPHSGIIMAALWDSNERPPDFLEFYTTSGQFINGNIFYDKAQIGEVMQAHRGYLYTLKRLQKQGRQRTYINRYRFLPSQTGK